VRSATNTIRVPARTYERLRILAREVGKPMSSVLDEAIERLEADRFYRDLDASFRDLRADPEAWASEQADRQGLDATLRDGLDEL
jgi:predicted DNA-binding protein